MTPRELLSRLRAAGWCLATVESCTGGDVASALTDVAGSSDVFWGAFVTYDNSAKIAVGVPARLLRAHGAVSREVARALAEGGLARMRAALAGGVGKPRGLACLATTGIAGPSGGSPRKPVGLCYVACAASGRKTRVRRVLAPQGATRLANKRLFAREAMTLAGKTLGVTG
jgi:nicotinamide-nucleotide amidase